jgi:hypothetical protein
MNLGSVWRTGIALPVRRPLLFLLVSLLLAGTDLMLWRLGIYDGASPAGGDVATVLAIKLALLFLWALAALRMADAPERPVGDALRVDKRQALWLAGTLLALALLFGLRLALTKLATLALPAPRTALVVGLLLYLIVSLLLLVRALPGWAGALLGDREAALGWSWRATRGRVAGSTAIVLLAILPPLALHVGLNLFWLAELPSLRLALLLADGAVMALTVAIAMASYRCLWLRAKAAP